MNGFCGLGCKEDTVPQTKKKPHWLWPRGGGPESLGLPGCVRSPALVWISKRQEQLRLCEEGSPAKKGRGVTEEG